MYLTGTDGAAYNPYAYDPFGNRLDPTTGKKHRTLEFKQNQGYTREGNIIQPFAFTGYREEENGLYYAQARSYDSQAGRFTSEDRVRGLVAMPDTVNHYVYCLNDPKIYIDANGLWPSLASIGEGLKNVGKGLADSTVGVVKQAIDDPGKFAAAAVTGLAVGVVTGLAAGALVAAAPGVLATLAVGTVAFGVAGAITAVAADYVGQKASKYYDPKEGVNHDELKASAVAGWTFGSIFGGGATAITKFAGKTALTLGVKTLLGFGAGFGSGVASDLYIQSKDPTVSSLSVGHAIGSGLGTGVFSALTIYGLGKLQQKIENKIACGAESGERQRNLDKWGTDSNGCNQGERHFNNYWEKYPERIPSLEQRLGLEEGTFANNEEGFNNFTAQAEGVVERATEAGTYKNVNGKTIYYVDGAANPKKGVVVIVKDGKLQSMMPSDPKSYSKLQ